jgi:hypothetical protein
MSFTERLQSAAETHLAEGLIVLVSGAGGWVAHTVVDNILPGRAVEALDSSLAAQLIVALLLVIALLTAWVVYLRRPKKQTVAEPQKVEPQKPNRQFTEFGFWKNLGDGLDYCAKCNVTPLHRKEVGWYCVTCHQLYDDPEFQKKKKEEAEKRRREEDVLVRRINSGDNSWMA